MDYNELFKDTEIGASMFELSKLNEDVTQDMATPILKAGKQKGELRFDVSYYPVLKPQTNEPGVEELPESSKFSGHCSFYLHQILNHTRRCGYRAIHGSPG
jgi:Ca2+-dependent lipid-binding protein